TPSLHDALPILTTNADILFSDSLIQRLKQVFNSGSVLSPVIYRAIRNDVAEGVPPAGASDPKNWLFSHHTTPPYHSEGAGDFLLASKSMYCALRGFNETVRIADVHKDTQFCIHAHKLGFSLEVIGDVYHLYHATSSIHLSLDARMAAGALRGKPYNYRADVPYLNSSDWGLESYRERRSDDGLTHFVAESEAVVLEPVPPVDV